MHLKTVNIIDFIIIIYCERIFLQTDQNLVVYVISKRDFFRSMERMWTDLVVVFCIALNTSHAVNMFVNWKSILLFIASAHVTSPSRNTRNYLENELCFSKCALKNHHYSCKNVMLTLQNLEAFCIGDSFKLSSANAAAAEFD